MNYESTPKTYEVKYDEEFKNLPDYQRMQIAAQNRIINTDTYNRTMDALRGPEGWKEQETYVLQMRRAPHNYLVVAGVEDAITELTDSPITQTELDFAESFYEARNIPFFNKAMWETVVNDYDGKLPFEIHGAPDGTVVLPTEPILSVTGPGELVAHFEHVFHRAYYSTLVATRAHQIRQILGDPNRFIEVGKRSTPDENTHLQAVKAMLIGGRMSLTSNDAAVASFEEIQPIGTIGHRYVQRFPDVETAFRHAIENLDKVTLLVDLIDPYDGLDLTLKLKEEYRETSKVIYARLDSADIKEQLHYYIKQCEDRGFTDPVLDRIVVEGIESIEEIEDIEASLTEDQKKRVSYGAGGLLVAQGTTRSDASSGFKLASYEDAEGELVSTMKFSDGKHSLPGNPTIALVDGKRVIAQVEEVSAGQDLLAPLYINGERRAASSIEEAQQRCEQQYNSMLKLIESGSKPEVSKETARKIGEVMCRYGLGE